MIRPARPGHGTPFIEVSHSTVIGDLTIQQVLSGVPERLIPREVPSPPADFLGRDNELTALLSGAKSGGVVIDGMGGCGKTVLACAAARKLVPQHFESSIFADLRGTDKKPRTPRSVMAQVIGSFRPQLTIPSSRERVAGLYQTILSEEHALLVLDNASDSEQIEALIPPSSCACIVTSRRVISVPGFPRISISSLNAAAAQALVLKIAPRAADLAVELAEVCANLPIAIRLAAGVINERIDIAPRDHLAELRNTQGDLVGNTLQLTLNIIPPATRDNWIKACIFEEMFDAEGAAAIWAVESKTSLKILGELLAVNLLEWNSETDRYRIHDLAREYGFVRIDSFEAQPLFERFSQHFVMKAERALKERDAGDFMESMQLDWPNIVAARQWAIGNWKSSPRAAELVQKFAEGGCAVFLMVRDQGQYLSWLSDALVVDRALEDKEAEAEHSVQAGYLHIAVQNLDAAAASFEKASELYLSLGSLKNAASSMVALGKLGDVRNVKQRMKALEQAASLAESVKAVKIAAEARAQLGRLQFQEGDTNSASESFEHAIAGYELLQERLAVAEISVDLALCYTQQRKTKAGRTLMTRSIEIATAAGDKGLLANLLYVNGMVECDPDYGDARVALESATKARDLASELGDAGLVEESERVRGGAAYVLARKAVSNQQLKSAIEFYSLQLNIGRQYNIPRYISQALHGLGLAELSKGSAADFKAASTILAAAAEVAAGENDRELQGAATFFLSLAREAVGDKKAAKVHAAQAAILLSGAGGPLEAKAKKRAIDLS